jgi:hypothetical protein
MSPRKPPDSAIPTDPTDSLVIGVARARARVCKGLSNQPVGSVGTVGGGGRARPTGRPLDATAPGRLLV